MVSRSPSPALPTLTCRLTCERVTKPGRTCGTQACGYRKFTSPHATPDTHNEAAALNPQVPKRWPPALLVTTGRCRKAVGIPPRFRFERFQFKEFRLDRFRFEHGGLSVAARTPRPDVAVVAALADPGRAVLVPPRRPLLADATLPLLALTHLGDTLPRLAEPQGSRTPPERAQRSLPGLRAWRPARGGPTPPRGTGRRRAFAWRQATTRPGPLPIAAPRQSRSCRSGAGKSSGHSGR
jgi:hypothetical protein